MPQPSAESLSLLAVAMVSGALLYGLLISRLGRLRRSWIAKRRANIAAQGERNAIDLLQQHGYAVVATQCPMTWNIQVNGIAIPIELRADAIVERDGRRYVAEIKTGCEAPHVETAQTRRQLLEYLVAYQADGALLVNMPQHCIQEIRFAPKATAVSTRFFRLVIWIGLLSTTLWLLLQSRCFMTSNDIWYDDMAIDPKLAQSVTVSPKYQVVIPLRIRRHLGLRPGEKMQMFTYGGRVELVRVKPLRELRGYLKGIDVHIERDDDRL